MTWRATGSVVVVGQLGRDLVLEIDAVPDGGGSTAAHRRIERLGGKGANQAVALTQLGVHVAVIGVVGLDASGALALDDAATSGIDVTHVISRGTTALFLDLLQKDGTRRLIEHVPVDALLTAADVRSAAAPLREADTVCLQLQQPPDALLAARDLAIERGVMLVLDGAVDDPEVWQRLVTSAAVVRADAEETTIIAGGAVDDAERARSTAAGVLDAGARVVALEVPDQGNLVAWPGGDRLFPLAPGPVVDSTGGGDAFLAGLVAALRHGARPEEAGAFAARAAGSVVHRPGGRPDLTSLRAHLPDPR